MTGLDRFFNPCPFCGGQPTLKFTPCNMSYLICDCGCIMQLMHKGDINPADVINTLRDKWNHRVKESKIESEDYSDEECSYMDLADEIYEQNGEDLGCEEETKRVG